MKRVFLAFAFRDEDCDLVTAVEQLLASFDVRATTGERLGGGPITPLVQARIDQAGGLIALLTRRDQKVGGGWTTHQWVQDELNYGRNQHKRTIALIEDGVTVEGAYVQHEWIALKRDNPLPAFLGLAETVGTWQREVGRTVKVRILPDELSRLVGYNDAIKCRYRFVVEGRYTEWRDIPPVMEPGGTFVYLEGVRDEYMIQLMAEDQRSTWVSPATSQWMQIRLARRGTNQ